MPDLLILLPCLPSRLLSAIPFVKVDMTLPYRVVDVRSVARPETQASLGGKSRGGLRPKRTSFHDDNIPSRIQVGRKLYRDTGAQLGAQIVWTELG